MFLDQSMSIFQRFLPRLKLTLTVTTTNIIDSYLLTIIYEYLNTMKKYCLRIIQSKYEYSMYHVVYFASSNQKEITRLKHVK